MKKKEKEGYVTPSLVPKLSSGAGVVEKRAWHPLFAHGLNFIRNKPSHTDIFPSHCTLIMSHLRLLELYPGSLVHWNLGLSKGDLLLLSILQL